jgi:aminoacrylate hydrolase
MPKAAAANAEIHYEIHGRGSAVLLVPGLGGVGSYWNPNIPQFSGSFRVIIHGHRGTGQSTRSKIRYSKPDIKVR